MMVPFVLSGGSGTRLWPVSTPDVPKQFCLILDESLFAKTLKRLAPFGSPWTLTTKELAAPSQLCYASLGFPKTQILAEPMGKNTAPAIAAICRYMQILGREKEIVGIFPADHLIQDEAEFGKAVQLAVQEAKNGRVVTLGIYPTRPATGFGYIEVDSAPANRNQLTLHSVRGFREKPNLEQAQEFLAQGKFLWNAGIFIFECKSLIEKFQKIQPELWKKISLLEKDLSNWAEIYQSLSALSFDYAIMEKLDEQSCVRCDPGWSDLGSWEDIALQAQKGSIKFESAKIQTLDSNKSFVFSKLKKNYALIECDDLILVDTEDALLAVKRGQVQRVREAAEFAKTNPAKGISSGKNEEARAEKRPWGGYRILEDTEYYKTKHIYVQPGSQISYQSHAQRAEHWIVVKGRGEVVLDDKTIPVAMGQSVYIPQGAKHRIRCTGTENLEFIEVQTGTYFGEDDIVRYQDDYGRS